MGISTLPLKIMFQIQIFKHLSKINIQQFKKITSNDDSSIYLFLSTQLYLLNIIHLHINMSGIPADQYASN